MKKLLAIALLLSGCLASSSSTEESADTTAATVQTAQDVLAPGSPATVPVPVPGALTLKAHPLECQSCVSNTECSDSPCGIICRRSGGFGGSCGIINP